jgi:DNA-binding response OmpR family regulator
MPVHATRVLVVDDEKNERLNFRTTLETEGYEIFEASSAERALELLAEHSFALAILDLRMPGIGGLELLARMRASEINVPAMIVTAYSDVPHAVKAMKLGAIDFLQKPIRPNDLRNAVAQITERHAHEDDRADSFETNLIAAKRSINLGSFAKARLHLRMALALNEKSSEAFNLAGVLAEINEDYNQAKKCYGQAIRLDRNYEPAQQNMRRLFEVEHFGSSNEPVNLGTSENLSPPNSRITSL